MAFRAALLQLQKQGMASAASARLSANAVLHATPAGAVIAKYPLVAGAAGVVALGAAGAQAAFGKAEHFYDHRFTTNANPNDLAEFYGNEDFMEIFCVFPFMVDFMMRSGHFDDAGHVHTFGLPGSMEVSMMFEECEQDTTGDGENDTVVCFNKQERFHDTLFGWPMWDMVQNFGFKQNEDGSSTVYHYGERIEAPFPIRIVFQLHAMYVIWAVEQHVNSPLFGAEDDLEDAEIAQRHNIPFHVMGEFLSGLQGDVEDKLGVARAREIDEANSEAMEALKAEVAELEETLEKLKAAQLRRNDTSVVSRVTNARRVTRITQPTLLARSTKVSASDAADDAEIMERAMTRAATKAKLALKVDDAEMQETIQAAVAQVAGSSPAALQRRLTSLYASAEVHTAAFDGEEEEVAPAFTPAPPAEDEPVAPLLSATAPAEAAPAAPAADAFAAELADKKAAIMAALPAAPVAAPVVAAPLVAAPAAPSSVGFAKEMIRRATMIRRDTMGQAADMANQGVRVEVNKSKFHPDGYKVEESKITFHPRATRTEVVASSPAFPGVQQQ